ncbi:hypothetical protein AB4Y63_01480 [Leifsonia sp. YAF41]|uniref:hypothetical protein n=1 Tax=Leifsonia sp. YAF41 TaxID=3233086 RepID=UPI003F952BF2
MVKTGRARVWMWTQVFKTCLLGTLGILLLAHGIFEVRDGINVIGGLIYLAAGLFIIVLELGLLVFTIWLLRRVSASNALEEV